MREPRRLVPAVLLVAAGLATAAAQASAAGYATDDRGRLYRVFPASKEVELVGTVGVPADPATGAGPTHPILTDIALHDEHGMYGISYSVLYKIDLRDPGRSVRIGPLQTAHPDCNALEFDDEGTLYAAAGNLLYRVDRASGRAARIGSFGADWISDGDLAWIDGALYATVNGPEGCLLVTVDRKTGRATAVGTIRDGEKRALADVWGLVWDGRTLWGLTPGGDVLALDRKSARATPRFRAPVTYWGACPMLRI